MGVKPIDSWYSNWSGSGTETLRHSSNLMRREDCVQNLHSLEAVYVMTVRASGAINIDRCEHDNDLLTTMGSEETVNRIVNVGGILHDSDGGQQCLQPARFCNQAEQSGRLLPRVYVILSPDWTFPKPVSLGRTLGFGFK
jgi:hypothetical protein